MADKKISDFTAKADKDIGDLGEIEDGASGNSRKVRAGVDGTACGTAFPGSPTTDDRFYRTDRRIEYFYDGTRWLSTQIHFTAHADISGASATASFGVTTNPFAGLYALWAVDVVFQKVLVGTGNWTLTYKTEDAGVLATIATGTAFTNTTRDNETVAVGATVASTVEIFLLTATENSGTATVFGGGSLRFRLIG